MRCVPPGGCGRPLAYVLLDVRDHIEGLESLSVDDSSGGRTSAGRKVVRG